MSIFRCQKCGRINRVKLSSSEERTPHCGECKSDLDVSGIPQDLNAKEVKRAIANSPIPVLLDVWAPWCGPCKMVAPVLHELGQDRKGELLILKLNSDENQSMSASLKVSGIPTMLLFKKGKEIARQSGAMPKSSLNTWLGQYL